MASVDKLKKRLQTIVTSLQKSVECPICLETVKASFKVCVRGHGVCLECTKKLQKCPLCQESFILENLVCVKSILEASPKLCCYTNEGCEEVVEPGNDHEVFCGYRPITCRRQACSVKVPVKQLLQHYETCHPTDSIIRKEENNVTWEINPKHKRFAYIPVFLYNNLFWILQINNVKEGQFKIFFQATPTGKLEHDYYVRIKFDKEKFNYTYTLKVSEISSCENKYEGKDDDDEKVEILSEKYCMKIPQSELSRFKNITGKLEFDLDTFKVKSLEPNYDD